MSKVINFLTKEKEQRKRKIINKDVNKNILKYFMCSEKKKKECFEYFL